MNQRNCITFATTELATLLIFGLANQGETFFYMMVRKYTNNAITLSQQIQVLSDRGLIIDIDNPEYYLERINYFRFSRYLSSFRLGNDKHYAPNTKFSDVITLYNFDIDLRHFISKLIQTIEISFRSKMINSLSTLSPHWFMEKNLATRDDVF